ncbi:MAG: hypothetical protein GY788_02375 [bacterium]|nr:hypothetical protein [bacterium]
MDKTEMEPVTIPDSIFDDAKALGDCSIEDLLQFLRDNGLQKLASSIVVQKIRNMERRDALNVVHFSETWKDRREVDEKWQNAFLDVLEEIAAGPESKDH